MSDEDEVSRILSEEEGFIPGGDFIEKQDMKETEEVELISVTNDLPDFATPETRRIDNDIKEKTQKLKEIDNQLSDVEIRITEGQSTIKQAEEEIENLNKLLDAKKKQIATESHLQALAARESSRVEKDRIDIRNEISRVQDEIDSLQNTIEKRKNKLAEFRDLIQVSEEELELYTKSLKKNEDDAAALDKYTEKDNKRLKKLRLELEKKSIELVKARDRVADRHSQLLVKKGEIDHMLQEYAELQKEREFVLVQWEKSLQELKRRDKQLETLRSQLEQSNARNAELTSSLAIEESQFEEQCKLNQELEKSSEELAAVLSKKRQEELDLQATLKTLQIDCKGVNSEVTFLKQKMKYQKDANMALECDIEKKKALFAREQEKLAVVTAQVEEAKQTTVDLSPDQTIASAEKELEDAEKAHEQKLARMKHLQDKLAKERQVSMQLKEAELAAKTKRTSNTNRSKQYDAQMSKLEEELDRQETLLLHADQKLFDIEAKLAARGICEQSSEDKEKFQDRMTALEKEEQEVKDRRRALKAQAHKTENEVARVKKERDLVQKEIAILQDRMQDMTLENTKIDTQLSHSIRTKEELLVHHDLLLLNVRKLRETVSTSSEAVYEALAAKEAQDSAFAGELQAKEGEFNLLKAEVKLLNEQKHRVILDLNAKRMYLSKLEIRQEVMQGSLNMDGLTQAEREVQRVRIAEQNKQHFQATQAELARVEIEVDALQKLLAHTHASNAAYKESLIQSNPVAMQARQIRELEKEFATKKHDYRALKTNLDLLNAQEKEKRDQFDAISKELVLVQGQEESLSRQNELLDSEISTLQSQLDRLDTDIHKVFGSSRVLGTTQPAAPVFSDDLDLESRAVDDVEPATNSETLSASARSVARTVDDRESAVSADSVRHIEKNSPTLPSVASYMSKRAAAALEAHKADNAQIVLYLLGQLAQQHPEIQETVWATLKSYKLTIPTRCPFEASTRVRGSLTNNTSLTSGTQPFVGASSDRVTLPSINGSASSTRGVAVKQTNISLNL